MRSKRSTSREEVGWRARRQGAVAACLPGVGAGVAISLGRSWVGLRSRREEQRRRARREAVTGKELGRPALAAKERWWPALARGGAAAALFWVGAGVAISLGRSWVGLRSRREEQRRRARREAVTGKELGRPALAAKERWWPALARGGAAAALFYDGGSRRGEEKSHVARPQAARPKAWPRHLCSGAPQPLSPPFLRVLLRPKPKPQRDLTKGYSRLSGGEHQREKSSPRAGIREIPSRGEIDAIAIVIERDIISIIIIIISTIYTTITTAAPLKDLVTENVEEGHIIFCEDASNIVSHPNKPKQVSVPMLSVRIGDHCYYGLCDIGASVSAIPYELYTEIMHEIGSCELEDIDVVIHLANRETISPIGIVRDVEVLCGKIKYPADFLQHLENSESEAFRKERDELEEIFLRQPILKHDLPVEDLGTTPPPKEDPVFDLKPLPDNLKYAHIDDKKIYPVIISSKLSEIEEERWVSPVHCVPKKGGMTVVPNDNDELIPQRIVVGSSSACSDLDSFPCVEEAIRVDEFCDQYRALRREVEILQEENQRLRRMLEYYSNPSTRPSSPHSGNNESLQVLVQNYKIEKLKLKEILMKRERNPSPSSPKE
ncbi:hypothetical protein QYE76_021154 [Lolium multiflorum]|uniref:Uncharacterized protein n=1 Tax=Lolium multiflorum TaxID=4521 RepID=A0AAD8R778_LOLMU|nr:hypothetical protein QYE76_021154 [Lolium multiflorum]